MCFLENEFLIYALVNKITIKMNTKLKPVENIEVYI
jgi:hypothetical protein